MVLQQIGTVQAQLHFNTASCRFSLAQYALEGFSQCRMNIEEAAILLTTYNLMDICMTEKIQKMEDVLT